MSWWRRQAISQQQKAKPQIADSPAHDHAAVVLQQATEMSDAARATAWDMFHGSKNHLEFARKIQHVEMSNGTRHRLFEAKRATAPAVDPVAKVRSAIESVSKLDRNDLEVAEKNSHVLKLFVDALIPKGKRGDSNGKP
jgi:hypothetical protein